MKPSATFGAGHAVSRFGAGSLSTWVELLAVVAAIGLLLPLFERLAAIGPGRDGRFAKAGFEVKGLPAAVLPRLCEAVGAAAEPFVREGVCGMAAPQSPAQPLGPALPMLRDAVAGATRAFQTPVYAASMRLDGLRAEQREGRANGRDVADEIAAIETDIRPFMERFRLAGTAGAAPAPLACAATRILDASVSPVTAAAGSGAKAAGPESEAIRHEAEAARANAVLLLAAALDGADATRAIAAEALLPPASASPSSACSADLAVALADTAALLRDARRAESNARKNAAMLTLLQEAGLQWAAAMALGYAFVLWSRSGLTNPLAGVAAALGLWAGLAWLGRVPWPLAGHHEFVLARLDEDLTGRPAGFVVVMGVAAALLMFWAWARRKDGAAPPLRAGLAPSSRIGYPGLVIATGVGGLLLLDLSIHGAFGNRYLALYHQGHLWLGMLVFSTLLFLRRPLARGLGWTLAVAGEAGSHAVRRFGSAGFGVGLVLGTLAAVGVFGLALANKRQLTSELGRVWLIVGAAWFFFLRGGTLAERLASSHGSLASFGRYMWPMFFVVGVLIAAMVATRDMGPLLIAGYASGGFLAAAVAAWWHQRSGRAASAFLLAIFLFAAWIAITTCALFMLGAVDSVTAARLESLAAPLASGNDQLALVTWFQRAAPADGFGLGAAPWCGYAATGRCSGVPAQIHSDYTFTALVGVFGKAAAWAAALGCAVWLHRLVRHHGRVTRGEPRLFATPGRMGHDGQALLSWIGVAWVVLTSCQLAVTVAGNLAVLPLTGVTFPFVSFGMTSLVVNLAFLALCLHLDVPNGGSHG